MDIAAPGVSILSCQPGGGYQLLSGTSPPGVAVAPALTLTFDALGRTNLGNDQSIAVGPFSMTVRAESGFVQAP